MQSVCRGIIFLSRGDGDLGFLLDLSKLLGLWLSLGLDGWGGRWNNARWGWWVWRWVFCWGWGGGVGGGVVLWGGGGVFSRGGGGKPPPPPQNTPPPSSNHS